VPGVITKDLVVDPPKEQASSEFSAMKQEEQMKEKLLAGAKRIYQQDEVNPLLT
jgi:hypothetical protein